MVFAVMLFMTGPMPTTDGNALLGEEAMTCRNDLIICFNLEGILAGQKASLSYAYPPSR